MGPTKVSIYFVIYTSQYSLTYAFKFYIQILYVY